MTRPTRVNHLLSLVSLLGCFVSDRNNKYLRHSTSSCNTMLWPVSQNQKHIIEAQCAACTPFISRVAESIVVASVVFDLSALEQHDLFNHCASHSSDSSCMCLNTGLECAATHRDSETLDRATQPQLLICTWRRDSLLAKAWQGSPNHTNPTQ